jgi:cytochrome P450
MRRVTSDAEAAGVALRRGDVIVLGCWGHNRLADVFTDPASFRPERWAASDFGTYDSLTFSAGPRRCVGFSLAMIMIKVTLATILASRRPRIVPQTRIDMRVAINLRSRGPIPVVMARRDQDFQHAAVSGTVTRLYTPSGQTA